MSSALVNSNRVDGVLAATHKLVQQAMTGQWQEVPRTVQERRELLDSLTASASPQDRQWLGALQQAMAESDAAVAQMAAAGSPAQNSSSQNSSSQNSPAPNAGQGSLEVPDSALLDSAMLDSARVDSLMEMLKKSR